MVVLNGYGIETSLVLVAESMAKGILLYITVPTLNDPLLLFVNSPLLHMLTRCLSV